MIFTCIHIGLKSLNIFFFRTNRLISIQRDTKHPTYVEYREMKFVQIKGQVLFIEDIIAKIGWDHLNFFLKNHCPRKTQIYIKASQYSAI
jgi:hypothetical protein